ncbi:MAG: hypothetical protein LJE94_07830 [Deltaproteobacteria bacterium]|nr:hypothetical protein [Deltaproteobacteria bacterium]
MPIAVEKDNARQLTVFTVEGELDFEDLLAYMKSYSDEFALDRNCVWDFRPATGGEVITDEQLGYFAAMITQYAYKTPVMKMGFVIEGDLGFGLARMLSTFEELYDVALDAKVFLSMEDADGWMQLD